MEAEPIAWRSLLHLRPSPSGPDSSAGGAAAPAKTLGVPPWRSVCGWAVCWVSPLLESPLCAARFLREAVVGVPLAGAALPPPRAPGSAAGAVAAGGLALRPCRSPALSRSVLVAIGTRAEASLRKCDVPASANGDRQAWRAAGPDWDVKSRDLARGAAHHLAPMALP